MGVVQVELYVKNFCNIQIQSAPNSLGVQLYWLLSVPQVMYISDIRQASISMKMGLIFSNNLSLASVIVYSGNLFAKIKVLLDILPLENLSQSMFYR